MLSFDMTDAQFAAAASRLRTNGIDLAGPTGTISKDGVTAKYFHTGTKLTVEITGHPSFLPLSLIEGKLQAYFEQSIVAGESR